MKFNLADNVAFLLFRIVSKISADASRAFKSAGVSTVQARILLALFSAETWTVGDLCQFTAIDQSTMSHSLVVLVRRGLLSKASSSERQSNCACEVDREGAGNGTSMRSSTVTL
jgi:DNA-binding MarR family transcriptional regulator